MGCRFIFPESDFDPSNSIGSRNLSVLTSTLIGLATESSLNRFSILLSTYFPWPLVIIEMLLQSPGNRGLEGRKSSVGSTVFLHTSAKIQLRNLASNYSFFSMSIKRGMEVRLSKAVYQKFFPVTLREKNLWQPG